LLASAAGALQHVRFAMDQKRASALRMQCPLLKKANVARRVSGNWADDYSHRISIIDRHAMLCRLGAAPSRPRRR